MAKRLKFNDFLIIAASAVLGNWVGAQARTMVTHEPTQGIVFNHRDAAGNLYITVPVHTNFLPALLMGLVTRRWLAAFLTGIAATAWMGTRVQERILERMARRM